MHEELLRRVGVAAFSEGLEHGRAFDVVRDLVDCHFAALNAYWQSAWKDGDSLTQAVWVGQYLCGWVEAIHIKRMLRGQVMV